MNVEISVSMCKWEGAMGVNVCKGKVSVHGKV